MQESIQKLFNNFLTKSIQGTNDSDYHLATLFSLILQTKSKKILELGVRFGDTSEPLLAGAALMGGNLHCVDIHPTQWVCPEELTPFYKFTQSDAIAFLENEVKNNSQFDFCWVDDWHSADHVYKELELIDKMVTNESLVCLHDLMGGNSTPNYFKPMDKEGEWANGGPYMGVMKFLEHHPNYEMVTVPFNNGFTILRKT